MILTDPYDKLEKVLKDLCESAYWYGEDTGDYSMDDFSKTVGFSESMDKIKSIDHKESV